MRSPKQKKMFCYRRGLKIQALVCDFKLWYTVSKRTASVSPTELGRSFYLSFAVLYIFLAR